MGGCSAAAAGSTVVVSHARVSAGGWSAVFSAVVCGAASAAGIRACSIPSARYSCPRAGCCAAGPALRLRAVGSFTPRVHERAWLVELANAADSVRAGTGGRSPSARANARS